MQVIVYQVLFQRSQRKPRVFHDWDGMLKGILQEFKPIIAIHGLCRGKNIRYISLLTVLETSFGMLCKFVYLWIFQWKHCPFRLILYKNCTWWQKLHIRVKTRLNLSYFDSIRRHSIPCTSHVNKLWARRVQCEFFRALQTLSIGSWRSAVVLERATWEPKKWKHL